MSTAYTVKTTYTASDHVSDVMARMASQHAAMARGMGKHLDVVATRIGGLADKARAAAMALGGIGAAMVGGAAAVARVGMEFDQTLMAAAVKFPEAVKRGSAEFAALEAAAKRVGSTTQFSSSQAAQGLKDLAAAGFSVEAAIAALPEIANLAVAAETDLTTASAMAADAIGAMGLPAGSVEEKTRSLTYAMDLMLAGADASTISFEEMFQSLTKAGPMAAAAKVPMEQLAGAIATLGSSGTKAEIAGTHLKIMLQQLQTGAGAKTFEALGIAVQHGADGGLDFVATLREIQKATDGLSLEGKTKALTDIFGSNAISSALTLTATASTTLNDATDAMGRAGGSVAAKAKELGSTDLAAWNNLTSAIEGVTLTAWRLIQGPVRAGIDSFAAWANNVGAVLDNNKALAGDLAGSFMGTLMGLGQTIVGLVGAYASLRAIQWSVTAIQYAWNTALAVGNGVMWLFTAASTAAAAVTTFRNVGLTAGIAVLLGHMTATQAATAAQTGLNLAMLANPALMIAAGLMGIVGIVLYLTGALGWLTKAFGFLWKSSMTAAHGIGNLTESAGNASGALSQLSAQVGGPWPAINIPVNYMPGQMPPPPGPGGSQDPTALAVEDWAAGAFSDPFAKPTKKPAAPASQPARPTFEFSRGQDDGLLFPSDREAAATARREKAAADAAVSLSVQSSTERSSGIGGESTIYVMPAPGAAATQAPGSTLRGVQLSVPRTGAP